MGTISHPLCIDLFCGLGGWSDGFLAEGYEVVGFDVERHDYGTGGYPGQLVLQDVHTIHGSQFRQAACIVASPPCQEFSYMAMPWSRAKQIARALRGDGEFPEGYTGSRTIAELTALFDACFRIQREASEAAGRHIPMVVENVRGAEPWVGRSRWHYGSFYLWGDIPALMPHSCRLKQPKHPGVNFHANEHGGVSPAFNGLKVPGLNFHEYEKTGKPGRSFQSAAVEGLKVPGIKLSDVGFNVAARNALGDIPKPEGYQRSAEEKRQHIGHARKAASAAIAKIPFDLARWIAHCCRPDNQEKAA